MGTVKKEGYKPKPDNVDKLKRFIELKQFLKKQDKK